MLAGEDMVLRGCIAKNWVINGWLCVTGQWRCDKLCLVLLFSYHIISVHYYAPLLIQSCFSGISVHNTSSWERCIPVAINLRAGFTRNVMPAPTNTLPCCLHHHCRPQTELTATHTSQLTVLVADSVLICSLEIVKLDIANLINKGYFDICRDILGWCYVAHIWQWTCNHAHMTEWQQSSPSRKRLREFTKWSMTFYMLCLWSPLLA